MSGLHKAKKSKKLRKVGRNAAYCLQYKNLNRREKNKVIRLRNHLDRFPRDGVAKTAVDRCKAIISGR
jgi:hypothetical protein